MSLDPLSSPNPYRPYVVPIDTSPSVLSPSKSSARDIFADLDIPTAYLENPEFSDLVSNLVAKGVSKYASIFIRQPFEIVKTTMQVQYLAPPGQRKFPLPQSSRRRGMSESDDNYDDDASDSSEDPPLFSASGMTPPGSPSSFAPRGRSRRRASQRESYIPIPDVQPWELPRDVTGVRTILNALWTKEGAWGIWKGSNSTFAYSVLFDGIETWLSSLLAATFALPDPTLFDILDSPTPGVSLAAALTATAVTALILAPIDIYRITKIILPVSTARYPQAKTVPTPVIIPKSLVLPTILHAIIPNYLSSLFTLTLRPYFPRVTFSPAHYGLPFLASFVDLGIKLPFESVLRRAQISYSKPERTIVRVGNYNGVLGTIWTMITEERGGIFRGWRIGFWGLMMAWLLKTTDALGRGHDVEF